jgi:hypothetical protein
MWTNVTPAAAVTSVKRAAGTPASPAGPPAAGAASFAVGTGAGAGRRAKYTTAATDKATATSATADQRKARPPARARSPPVC